MPEAAAGGRDVLDRTVVIGLRLLAWEAGTMARELTEQRMCDWLDQRLR